MYKQLGITTLELLLSLGITSSIATFTLSMAEEAEEAVAEFQEETLDINELRRKIKSGQSLTKEK